MKNSLIKIVTLAAGFAIQATGATIGIDARNGDRSTPFPTGTLATGTNFGSFRATIFGEGHTLVPLNSFRATNLASLDAIIVRQPQYYAFEPFPSVFLSAEISDIQSFVNAGHGLLVLAEAATATDNTVDNLNTLTMPWGVTYGASVLHGEGFTVTGFLPHPVSLGVNTVGLDFYRPIVAISSPAIDLTLLAGENDILAAVNGVSGSGNVVLLSDTSLWTDTDVQADRNIDFGDNRRLLQNAVAFIVPEPTGMDLIIAGGLIAGIAYRKNPSKKSA